MAVMIGEIALVSLAAVAEVFVQSLFGFLLVKFGILNETALRTMGRAHFNCFSPCLIFTMLGSSINVSTVLSLWSLLAFSFLIIVIASGLAILMRKISHPPEEFYHGFLLAAALGNNIALPLALLNSIVNNPNSLFVNDSTAESRGFAYVTVYFIPNLLLTFSVGYMMMESASKSSGVAEGLKDLGEDSSVKHVIQKKSWKNSQVVKTLRQVPLIAIFLGLIVALTHQDVWFAESSVLRPITRAMSLVGKASIPLSCIMLGGNLGLVKIRRKLKSSGMDNASTTTDESRPSSSTTNNIRVQDVRDEEAEAIGMNVMGQEGVKSRLPMMDSPHPIPSTTEFKGTIVILTDKSENLPKGHGTLKSIIAVSVLRLFVLPACNFGLFVGALYLNILPILDQMYWLVLLMEGAVPTAINVIVVLSIFQKGEKILSLVMFWQYLLSALSLALWLPFFIYYIEIISIG